MSPMPYKLSDTAQQLLRNERRKLAREQASLAEKQRADSKAGLPTGKMALPTPSKAFIQSVVPRLCTALASERVRCTLQVDIAKPGARYHQESAWTDFSRIYVCMNEDRLVNPPNAASIFRGFVFHEAGHIRFTVPLPQVLQDAGKTTADLTGNNRQWCWNLLEDQRMETLVTIDSPRKAMYFTPMVLDVLLSQPQPYAYGWVVWRRYLPKDVRRLLRDSFIAHYGLDECRNMERIITRYVQADTAAKLWSAVLDMEALVNRLGWMLQGTGSPDDHGRFGHARQDKGKYKQRGCPGGSSPSDDMDEGDEDGEGQPGKGKPSKGAKARRGKGGKPAKKSKDEAKDDGASKGDDGEGDDGEGDDASKDDKSDQGKSKSDQGKDDDTDDGEAGSGKGSSDEYDDADDFDADGLDYDAWGDGDEYANDPDDMDYDEDGTAGGYGAGYGTGNHDTGKTTNAPTPEEVKNAVEEALKQAREEVESDFAIIGDEKALNEGLAGAYDSTLVPWTAAGETEANTIGEAEALAVAMEQAFQASTMDQQPAWHEQQTRGVLNVGRYLTRQPAEREYWRQWKDDEQPGHNIAVSILLDYSGSMSGVTRQLAIVGYACKAACDKLGIPCTVVLWDSDAKVLWTGMDEARYVPVIEATGGTDPTRALNDIHTHRFDKAQHLVMVMTDAAWSGNAHMRSWQDEGRYFVGIGYNIGGDFARQMLGYGFNEAYAVTDLTDIVRHLEGAVTQAALVGSKD